MFKLIAVALCLLPVAIRAEACKPPDVAEADAALRYQARLRVIALDCVGGPAGGSLYTQYQTFTARNADMLGDYRSKLLRYYKGHGRGDAATRLSARDTELNNEESLQASQKTAAFCRVHVPDLNGAATKTQEAVRQEIELVAASSSNGAGKCN